MKLQVFRVRILILIGVLFLAVSSVYAETAEEYFKSGNAHFEQGKYGQAISDYTKAIELNPNFAQAYYYRGVVYNKQGKYAQAETDLSKAKEINPKLVTIHYMPRKASLDQGKIMLILLIVLALYLFLLLIFLYPKKLEISFLKKIPINGSISKLSFLCPFFTAFNGEFQGFRVLITLVSGDPGEGLRISLFKGSFFKLSIFKSGQFSDLVKKLGINNQMKINDESFDKDFLIYSNAPAQVISYLNNETTKDAIRELFNSGFYSIGINSKRILIFKNTCNSKKDLEPEFITGILQKLILISKAM